MHIYEGNLHTKKLEKKITFPPKRGLHTDRWMDICFYRVALLMIIVYKRIVRCNIVIRRKQIFILKNKYLYDCHLWLFTVQFQITYFFVFQGLMLLYKYFEKHNLIDKSEEYLSKWSPIWANWFWQHSPNSNASQERHYK